jgi:hypothetical protein
MGFQRFRPFLLLACFVLVTRAGAEELVGWRYSADGLVAPTTNGFHFVGRGPGFAYAPWPAGAQPFTLTWELEVERGEAASWRWPGVAVAVTTARPGQMGSNDFAVVIGAHLEGLVADVRQGPLFAPNTNTAGWPPRFSVMSDTSLPKRFELNQGGARGRWYSVEWPVVSLEGTRLAFRVARTATNTVQFTFYHADFEAGREPWWQREWSLPARVATADFQYVTVQTTVNPEDFQNPGGPPRGGALAGWIGKLAGQRGPGAATWAGGLTDVMYQPLNDPGPHPCLYYRAADLPELRRKFNDPRFAGYRALILQNAELVPAGGGNTEKSGKAGIADLTWAYVLSGEKKYFQRLVPILEAESRSLQHEEFHMEAAHDMAVAYDALFAELPAGLRDRMQRYLQRVATVYVRQVKKNSWWYADNPSNTIAVGGAGGGAAGLALMHCSAVAREAVALAGATVKGRYRAIAPDGGCVEGSLYWNYGLTAHLRLGHMLQCATGDDAGLLDTPALRKSYRFVETQLGGDGMFFTFNDTQPWLTGLAICADLGSRFGQPLLLWTADYMANSLPGQQDRPPEVSLGDIVPYAFLWRGPQTAPKEFPGVPTASYLDTLNWGVLRSDSTFHPKLVVGVKGRDGVATHHAQPDLGSFVLQANGEAYLIDPGYYQPDAACHSLPLVNGQGPDAQGRALIAGVWEHGMTVDSTAAYRDATRVRRHFVLVGDETLILLDDIAAAGKITTHFQTGLPTVIGADKKAATITGKRGALTLRVFGPVGELSVQGPRDLDQSWIFKRMGVPWFTIAGEYPAGEPLVTVLTKSRAAVTVQHTPGACAVLLDGHVVARFTRESDGWQVSR